MLHIVRVNFKAHKMLLLMLILLDVYIALFTWYASCFHHFCENEQYNLHFLGVTLFPSLARVWQEFLISFSTLWQYKQQNILNSILETKCQAQESKVVSFQVKSKDSIFLLLQYLVYQAHLLILLSICQHYILVYP